MSGAKLSGANATLCLDGWTGRYRTPCIIVGETPKRYRIQAIERMALAGRNRWLDPGQTALVPKYAVRITESGREALGS
jgi:hypothetical protein